MPPPCEVAGRATSGRITLSSTPCPTSHATCAAAGDTTPASATHALAAHVRQDPAPAMANAMPA